ncbi:MAG: limonene-1,2-epoxide hydrolase family protein [Acidimicrobiia bacterium]
MSDEPIDVVRRFCDTWSTGDIDAIMAFFADDAVYDNIPMEAVTGTAAIRDFIAGFTDSIEKVEFRVDNIASADSDVVLTERVDIFTLQGKTIELPVMGTFEVRGGKVAAWRDYFDLNQFMGQMPS